MDGICRSWCHHWCISSVAMSHFTHQKPFTLSLTTNFRLFQTHEFADDNFNFNEKFSKKVENTVGKGQFAHYRQFLLYLQCFQKISTADT